MKAIVMTEYGSPEVLQLKEVDKPAPKQNEILVRNHATSVNYGDLVARNNKNIPAREFHMPLLFWLMTRLSFGINKPNVTILGAEFAGVIEGVGRDVKSFKSGDEVFGYLAQGMGAYAEYICLPANGVVALKPDNMSYEEAAVIPMGAIMALFLLREKGSVQQGHKVLINGASGSIGSAAVQIARHYEAEVTGVCSTARVEFVRSLGADHVIDYKAEDFTKNGKRYDLIFDVLGVHPFSHYKNSLSQNGRCLYASFKSGQLFDMLRTALFAGKKVICALAPGSREDLVAVKKLVEAGAIKAIIDRRFALEQAAEAHRYVEDGLKKGHVAITI